MTDKAAAKLKSDGWKIVETTGFVHLVGPLWHRMVDGVYEYALIAEDKHHNRRGLVQGGVLMTFADRTCGMTARFTSGKPMLATVQLDTHFVEAGKIGEILISKPHVVRSTRSLILGSRSFHRALGWCSQAP
jgi:acyl-coenzyme A thioesterase PaaI-like protein